MDNRRSNVRNANATLPIAIRNKFDELQESLGTPFNNRSLLYNAFTHSSYVNEHRRKKFTDNERLEFLGDAVLELGVSRYLYSTEPTMTEGELTKLRAAIVCEPSLGEVFQRTRLRQLHPSWKRGRTDWWSDASCAIGRRL